LIDQLAEAQKSPSLNRPSMSGADEKYKFNLPDEYSANRKTPSLHQFSRTTLLLLQVALIASVPLLRLPGST
jgi:hypothetical protein